MNRILHVILGIVLGVSFGEAGVSADVKSGSQITWVIRYWGIQVERDVEDPQSAADQWRKRFGICGGTVGMTVGYFIRPTSPHLRKDDGRISDAVG